MNVPSGALAPRLIGKLPSENGRLVLIAGNKGVDIRLVCGLDVCVGVEQVVVLRPRDLGYVNVHTTVVLPVVRSIITECDQSRSTEAVGSKRSQSNDQADTVRLGSRNNIVYVAGAHFSIKVM